MKKIAERSVTLLAICSLLAILDDARAQGPTAAIAFRNETMGPVIIQGVSRINNMPRRGQPILVPPSRVGFDLNVPGGVRLINIYDAQQPSRILLNDFAVPVQSREISLVIRPHPMHRDRVIVIPAGTP